MYSIDYISKYEDLLEDMSAWIGGTTWDGHEKECDAFAGGVGPCDCIKAVREEWHKTHRLREIEFMHAVAADEGDKYTNKLVEENVFLKERVKTLAELIPRMMDLQNEIMLLKDELKTERDCERR